MQINWESKELPMGIWYNSFGFRQTPKMSVGLYLCSGDFSSYCCHFELVSFRKTIGRALTVASSQFCYLLAMMQVQIYRVQWNFVGAGWLPSYHWLSFLNNRNHLSRRIFYLFSLQSFYLSSPTSSPVYCLRFSTTHLYATLASALYALDFTTSWWRLAWTADIIPSSGSTKRKWLPWQNKQPETHTKCYGGTQGKNAHLPSGSIKG